MTAQLLKPTVKKEKATEIATTLSVAQPQMKEGTTLQKSSFLGEASAKVSPQDVRGTAPVNKPLRAGKGLPSKLNGDETLYIDFEDGEGMVAYDLNGDGATWGITGDPGSRCAFINYNSMMALDDWLIMPGVELQGGKAYRVSIDMWGRGTSYPEKLEVFLGTAQDPSAMTIEGIPLTTYGDTSPLNISNLIILPADGTYYVGLHACSDADMYTLFADNLTISAPMAADFPNNVTDFSVVQKEGVEGVATISFTIPTTLFNGETATSFTEAVVTRNGEVIKTISNPTPGEAVSFDDECGTGKYTWGVTVSNESGSCQESTVTLPIQGTFSVPYYKDFPTLDSMDEMTIIDADGDGATWELDPYQYYARLSTSGQSSDDWLISPPIAMGAGKIYEFNTLVSAGNPEAFPPKIAFYVGNAPTVEAMTVTVVPPTPITMYDTYFNEEFTVPADGKYYIGVHGCSTEWLALIKLMYFQITGGAYGDGPAKVMEAVIEPDWTSQTNTANISFVAPVVTGFGDPLSSITKIEILRDGTVVKTFDNPTPGSAYNYTDEVSTPGEYTYTILPFNENGEGGKVEQTVTIGAVGKSVPYLEDFTSTYRFDNELTFIDYNEDGQTFWHATQTNPPYAWIHYGDSSPTNDDYLITPAIWLDANTVYEVGADAWGTWENMEILAGSAPKVDALDTEIIPLFELTGDMENYSGKFQSTYAGNYYFAIHAKTDKRTDTFYVTNIFVNRVGAAAAPAAITDLTIVPGTGNELQFSFKAPTTTVVGNALNSIDAITVSRDGGEIQVFTNPAPGSTLSFTDTPVAQGEHIYVITPSLGGEIGEALTHVAYVGLDLPATPQNVVAEYVGEGKVRITWDPVTTTAHGVSVPAEGYIIIEVRDNVQTQLPFIETNEYEYYAVDPQDQELLYYGVFAVSEAGEVGEYALSNNVYAGKPYEMAYRESFADGSVSTIISQEYVIFKPSWGLATDASFSDVDPSDGDNGMAFMYGGSGSSSRLTTGIIDLATNAVNPTLSINVYNINPDAYTNEIAFDVKEVGSDVWNEVASYVIKDISNTQGWVRLDVDLSAYKGKNVFLGIRATAYTYLYTIIDAIRVANYAENDLGANIGIADKSVPAGENTTITVTVSNNGHNNAGAFEVELYKDGKLVDSKSDTNLADGAVRKYTFNQTLNVQDNDVVEYYAVVVYPNDEMLADNTTKVATVDVIKPVYPVVEDLDGSLDNGVVSLSWNEPSMDNVAPAPYTEGFETAESWNKTGACGWTFVDRDNAPVAGFQQFDFPGITIGETLASFFVVDMNEETLGEYGQFFEGVGGSAKTIGALLTYNGTACDDWMISPELYGGRQTAYFYVQEFLDGYTEIFQAYYSTGSTDPSDFIAIDAPVYYGGGWAEFSANLPEGAKRFALRRTSTSGAMMLVDDVTLRLAGGDPENLTLVGYNVYRDGERINNAPVVATSYTDTPQDNETHVYAVSAIYEEGESNVVMITLGNTTGVDNLASAVRVFGDKGKVVIAGAEGLEVAVSTADGKTLYNGVAGADLRVNANAGVCVVRIANRSYKVIVK